MLEWGKCNWNEITFILESYFNYCEFVQGVTKLVAKNTGYDYLAHFMKKSSYEHMP